jgi:glutamate 5-kinase
MGSKLEAARQVTAAGGNVIVASGRQPDVLNQILAGVEIGTLFLAKGKIVPSLKRWRVFSVQPRGRILIDDGARHALVGQGRSLLAVGIVDSVGDFDKGDVVSVVGPDGSEVARGLTNYESSELVRIRGLHSDQISSVLGHRPYQEVMHRDNLIVLAESQTPTDKNGNL